MKELTFTIQLPKKTENFSIMDSIVDTANDEQKQQKLTHEINVETRNKHIEVAAALQNDLNKQFERIGFKDCSVIKTYGSTNGYSHPYFTIAINNRAWIVKIQGKSHSKFEHSKYTTFTGDYEIKLIRNGFPWDNGYRMEDVEDILKELKSALVEWYKANPQGKK